MLLLISLLFMSYKLAFMSYSIRFLMSFCVISAPVIVYSYCRKNNIYKFIVVFFAMYYLCLVSTHLYSRPLAKIIGYFKEGYTIQQIRNFGQCSMLVFLDKLNEADRARYSKVCINESCMFSDYIKKNIDKRNKIIFFTDVAERLFLIKMLDFEGYQIDYGSLEDIDNMNMENYNLAIFESDNQLSTNIRQFEKRKFDISVISDTEIRDNTNSGNYCLYERYPNEVVSAYDNVDKIPFSVKCYYTDDYLLNKFKFKYLTQYTINLDFTDGANSESAKYVWRYRIFENKLNPVIK